MKICTDTNVKFEAPDGIYYKFGVEYPFGPSGSRWEFDIWAKDWDEAEARLLAIQNYSAIVGQTCGEYPVKRDTALMRWWMTALCAWKRLLS